MDCLQPHVRKNNGQLFLYLFARPFSTCFLCQTRQNTHHPYPLQQYYLPAETKISLVSDDKKDIGEILFSPYSSKSLDKLEFEKNDARVAQHSIHCNFKISSINGKVQHVKH
jgi:hypothetical protein